MRKQIFNIAVLLLTVIFAFQSCQKEIYDPGLSVDKNLPDIVQQAQVWVKEHSFRSKNATVDYSTLDFDWKAYGVKKNQQGQDVVYIPIANRYQAGKEYMELAFVAKEKVGTLKHYAGDFASEFVQLNFYAIDGKLALSGSFSTKTGKMTTRIALSNKSGKLQKIASSSNNNSGAEGNNTDGFIIDEVPVPPPTQPTWPPVIPPPPSGGGGSTPPPSGGGGGSVPTPPGGGGGYNPPSGGGSSSNQQSIFDFKTLSAEDKAKFTEMLNQALENCAYKALINYFRTNGYAEIKISATDAKMAIYQPSSSAIIYNSSMYLNYTELFSHELFHAYQHKNAYGESFNQYGSEKKPDGSVVPKPGNINIEFEQIVFQDISQRVKNGLSGVGNMFKGDGTQEGGDAKDAYISWINTLTNNGTSYPNIGSNTTFESDYSQHLSNFKLYGHPSYTPSSIIPSLKPEALKKLFNGSIGTNCGN